MACGFKLMPGDHFCQNCGVRVGEIDKSNNNDIFCNVCGAKVDDGDKFCPQCGSKVGSFKQEVKVDKTYFKDYKIKLDDLQAEFNLKESRVRELVDREFKESPRSYERFISTVNESADIFKNQIDIAYKIIELADDESPILEKELADKVNTLESIVDKVDALIDELIIHLSSNRQNNEEIKNLTEELDDLINSVKDY